MKQSLPLFPGCDVTDPTPSRNNYFDRDFKEKNDNKFISHYLPC